ncbi:HNH endonuclease [Salinibacter ruber]|uniref:HNH endonuclease n=1 Tax=Salinibacter ruber TaxID=146919 RepID=UPI0013C33118|nr:HNH endonuclease signature motif containing protein [Salinibacter ruber]
MRNLLLFIVFIVALNFAVILAPIIAVVGLVLWIFSGDNETDSPTKKHSTSWGSYEDFLQSEVWEEKRKAVMERADGVCEMEGCDRPATEVHHHTYEYGLGNTPNHHLQALCGPCHDEQHPEKPSRYLTPEEASEALKELLSENDRDNSSTR